MALETIEWGIKTKKYKSSKPFIISNRIIFNDIVIYSVHMSNASYFLKKKIMYSFLSSFKVNIIEIYEICNRKCDGKSCFFLLEVYTTNNIFIIDCRNIEDITELLLIKLHCLFREKETNCFNFY